MSFFDLILVQPIFNILVVIYSLIPGHDFGVAIIVFTILVRWALYPLVKKQLRQTKVMRELQPELVKIKARAKGNRQLESQLMMELYRERGVNPFSSIGTLLLQMPIFISLYAVIRLLSTDHANIAKYTYDFLKGLPGIKEAIATHLNSTLLGVLDLTKQASSAKGIYWPLMILAVVAAVVQYFQSRMLLPKPKEKRKLRDILKDQATGAKVDQAEMSALMTGKMIWLFPILTFMIATYLDGALVVYLVTTNTVAIFQQRRVLGQDETTLEKLSEKTKTRVQKAVEAEVVTPAPKTAKKKGSSKKKRR